MEALRKIDQACDALIRGVGHGQPQIAIQEFGQERVGSRDPEWGGPRHPFDLRKLKDPPAENQE
jgi:hypothetical protein